MATIQKRGGKYRVRVRRKGYATVTKTFIKKPVAQAWARKIESELDQQGTQDFSLAHRIIVSEVLDRYRSEVLPGHKRIHRELSRLRLLKRSFGSLKLAELTSVHISDFQKHRLKTVKPATVRADLSRLSVVLSYVEKDWNIPLPQGNPVRNVRLAKVRNAKTRRITKDEEAKVLNALSYTPLVQDVVRLAMETAMRRTEITSIAPEDIGLDRRLLHIPVSKNGSSRTIPLTREAVRILRRNRNGFDLKPDSVTRAFHRACERCGVSDLRFHDLRHEAVSRLFEKGLNVMEVASISGHKDLRMLMRYTHLRAEDLVSKIDAV